MPLVQVKCTNCGANLEIDNTLDAAVCPYCNVPFVVEKAINNYNNTTNHINAGSVNAYGGSSADFVVHGGVLEKYNGAAIEVVIPNSVKIIGRAFDSMAITSVVIPDSVQEIGSGAFYGCAALTSVTMGNSVQKIGRSAFEYCRALTAITIPDSVKEIGYYAFDGCSALTSLTIGNSVTEISSDAFRGCSSLIAIIIPASVQWIGSGAFLSCRSLWTVEIKGNPLIALHAFLDTPYQEAKDQEDKRRQEAKRQEEAKRQQEVKRQEEAKRREAEQKSGCYIATAVYGSYDCPEVWTLRRFRDNTLDRTWYGRAFIRTYYAVSPTLVRWFGKDSWFQALFRPMLDRLVARLRQSGVEDTAYQDKY